MRGKRQKRRLGADDLEPKRLKHKNSRAEREEFLFSISARLGVLVTKQFAVW
jgi:hypothetical protein